MQPRREVRRLADDPALLRCPRADKIADDGKPGRDPDAKLEPFGALQAADLADERKSGAHRPLGVVLMGLRVAEISENAVAHVFGDIPAETADRLGDRAMIGADDLAQILGIEAPRKRGRTDEIAEHHRQLTPLGLGGLWRRGEGRPVRAGCRQLRDGAQKLLAVPERYTELFEIRFGELGEHGTVDIGADEGFAVLAEPKPFQPVDDSFHRADPSARADRVLASRNALPAEKSRQMATPAAPQGSPPPRKHEKSLT